MAKQILAVIGATGNQGSGVVDELLERQKFTVRILTRNPNSDKTKALQAKGCEWCRATSPNQKLSNLHSKTLMGHLWSPTFGIPAHGKRNGARDSRRQGCQGCRGATSRVVNTPKLQGDFRREIRGNSLHGESPRGCGSEGRFLSVLHVCGSVHVLPELSGDDGPTTLSRWRQRLDNAQNPSAKVIHICDPVEMGRMSGRVFKYRDTVGAGHYLAQASELTSWQEIIDTLNAQGHNFRFKQVPNEVFDAFPFPGAAELREMMNYFEDYTYFGPNAYSMLSLARKLYPEGFTSFAEWASRHMIV